MAKSTL